ncbi:hypothetical protein QE152_g604 [Popillia japonica]
MKKRVALYLYGPTNVGKTCFVSKLIGLHNERYVYYPSQDVRFFMEGFRENFFKIIVFEEFNVRNFYISMLKRPCEGRTYSYPVKHAPAKLITFRGPVIFISNFHEILDPALKSRLEIVYADVPFWTGRPAVRPREDGDENNDEDYEMVVVDNDHDGDGMMMMMMMDTENDLTVADEQQTQIQQNQHISSDDDFVETPSISYSSCVPKHQSHLRIRRRCRRQNENDDEYKNNNII